MDTNESREIDTRNIVLGLIDAFHLAQRYEPREYAYAFCKELLYFYRTRTSTFLLVH